MYKPEIQLMGRLSSKYPAATCAAAARITYGKDFFDSKSSIEDAKLLKKLYKSGHHAVFEFAYFGFYITNVSRAFMAQLRTHRHLSFMCSSQHHENYGKYPVVCENKQVNLVSKFSFWAYKRLLKKGLNKHEARMCLPNSAGVNMLICGNARAWANVLRLRMCRRNVPEMVTVSSAIYKKLLEEFPALFSMVGPNCTDMYIKGCRDGQACK